MSDDDREELIELGYDPDDITDRGLRIEHDDDEQGRHDEAELDR